MPCIVPRPLRLTLCCVAAVVGFVGCSATPPPVPVTQVAAPTPVPPPVPPRAPEVGHSVLLGIDVLAMDGFAQVRGKTIALLTHPAGVNSRGMSTIEVLRHAPGVRLVELFCPEHGLRGEYPSGQNIPDHLDVRTGLMVYSLYNGIDLNHRPTRAQLRGIDAVVIDLQDIGSRSYSFIGAMKDCMEGCFLNGVEVIVLDRPNPLGGLKVDGPPLDPQWMSYVGAFRVPYVHGLTIGELARMAKEAPGVMHGVPDSVRLNGRLTVIPMRGWHRSMRWPDTGLTWVPTSPYIPDFSAVEGYPMTGLGCELGGFRNGIGSAFPFRGLFYHGVRFEALEADLRALNIPGIAFQRVNVSDPKTGKAETGLYVEISDWGAWRPTELSLYLMKLACRLDPRNPYAHPSKADLSLFMKCLGSTAFYNDLVTRGSRIDVESYVREWQVRAGVYQQQSRRYWLYF